MRAAQLSQGMKVITVLACWAAIAMVTAAAAAMPFDDLSMAVKPQPPQQHCNATMFVCGANSTFAPSWCARQNPFIVARPATPLANATAAEVPTLTGKYHCESDDPMAECTVITQFMPMEVPTVGNTTRKLIVVSMRLTNSSDHPSTVLGIMDEDFNLQLPTNPFPGLMSLVEYQHDRENSNDILVAYGGTTDRSWSFQANTVLPCPHGCVQLGQLSYGLMRVNGDAHNSNSTKFLNQFVVWDSQAVWTSLTYLSGVPVSALMITTTNALPTMLRLTMNHVTSAPYAPTLLANWTIAPSFWTAAMPTPALHLFSYYHDCTVSEKNDAYAFGSFFNYHICTEMPLLMIANPTTVVIAGFDGPATGSLDASQPTSVFYQADAGRVITAARLFGQVIPPPIMYNSSYASTAHSSPQADATPVKLPTVSQNLWMIVATESVHGGSNMMELVLLPEFGYNVTAESRSKFNPAGRASSGLRLCAVNQYYDARRGCTSRRSVVWTSATETISQLQIVWRDVTDHAKSQLTKAGCSVYDIACITKYAAQSGVDASNLFQPFAPNAGVSLPVTSQQVVGQYLNSAYGMRHVVFASTLSRTLLLLDAMPSPDANECPPTGPPKPIVTPVNSLSMMGDVGSLRVTENAQYVFTAVSRSRYALNSMERVVQVCKTLASTKSTDPTHQFLKPFSSACSQTPAPRYPTLADFLQIASACFPGMSCPSFNKEQVQQMPNGYYSNFFFDNHQCEPGYYCVGGQRQSCPTGFMCPGFGSMLPVACPTDPSLNYNCWGGGLAAPSLCPNGTICGVPYLPPLPAPPGFMQAYESSSTPALRAEEEADGSVMPAMPTRTLIACLPGQWCNLAASVALTRDQILCPNNTYCTTPAVMTPTICNMDGRCVQGNCTIGNAPYCPQGSTHQSPCPPGYYCSMPASATACLPGSYCPAGSPVWQVCPAGSYCPSTQHGGNIQQCPRGSYCPEASMSPVECNVFSSCNCPHGCKSPADFVSVPVLIIVPIVLWGGWKLAKYLIKRRRLARDHMLEEARAKHTHHHQHSALELESKPGELQVPLMAGDKYDDAESGMSRKDFTIDFHFEDMGLVLKGSGKPVMKGVTGCIRHGRVTAVMGPSGAGKSTFLTTLAGKATYGKQTGKIFINGNEKSLSHYSKLVGFVPQEDIMMRTMTVAENLQFCAETRLPNHWSAQRKLEFVDECLGLLGLREIKHSQIGDERKRGISGGQRKRVNIGMEMVADPTVLFLDEPTSGLDSSSSMEVCQALRSIADLGITIVTVIHQPRYEIFTMFHDVLLLGKGGRTVYLGPSEEALGYFEGLGLICPPRVNPPDFFMDVIAGDVPADFRAAHPDFHPNQLFDMWEAHRAAGKARTVPMPAPHAASPAEQEAVNRHAAGFLYMVWLSFKRAMWQHARSKAAIGIDIALVFIASVSLAAVYWGDSLYEPPQPLQVFTGCPNAIVAKCQLAMSAVVDNILNRGSMTCIAMGLTGVASMIRVYGSERVQYWREASGLGQPWHTFAYFLGKDLAMIPEILVAPLVYNIVYLSVTNPRGDFMTYYWVLLGMYYTAAGYGYLVSIVAPPNLSQLVGVVAVFGNAMFAGGMPVLKQLYTKIPPLCWLPYVSFIRYALEALYVGEVIKYADIVALQGGWDGQSLAQHLSDTFGYDLNAYGRDLAVLFGIGFLLRVITAILMAVMDRDKKV